MGETEVKVRVATLDDLDAIMALAFLACDENAFVDPDPVKLLQGIYPTLIGEGHGISGVIGPVGGPLEGVVVLSIGENWYSRATIIEERAVFVHPEYRAAKGGRARKLCEFSKSVADSLGLPLTIGILSNSKTAAKVRLYQRVMGCEPTGAYWIYGARTGEFERAAR